jgi:hypothetical protein
MLMKSGVVYNKQKLHKVGYFKELMATNPDISSELKPLLTICRETIVRIGKTESALVRSLRRDPLLHARVERLMTIPAIGPITALTWVLEVDDVARFHSVNYADVARILNEKGFKTGDGLPLTSIAVGYVRKAYGLKSRFDRLRERGMLTISEMARACGVSINTIGHWRQKGWIGAHSINDRTQFLFEDPGQNPPKKYARRVSAITIRL